MYQNTQLILPMETTTLIYGARQESLQLFLDLLYRAKRVEIEALHELLKSSLLIAMEREGMDGCLIIDGGQYDDVLTDKWFEDQGLQLRLQHVKVEGYKVNCHETGFQFEVEPDQHTRLLWMEETRAYAEYAANEGVMEQEIYYIQEEPYVSKMVPAYAVTKTSLGHGPLPRS